MATIKRKTGPRRKQKVTSSLDEIQMVLASGADVVLVVGSLKRPEVRIKSHDMVRVSRVGRFGFLEYYPKPHTSRFRVFLDGEDTGIERRILAAAMVQAVCQSSYVERVDSKDILADVACRVMGVTNR